VLAGGPRPGVNLSDWARGTVRGAARDYPPKIIVLETLNSARVATWCWVQARFPEMRVHGEHHLAVVRARWRFRDASRQ
jgi:hypothetical protein